MDKGRFFLCFWLAAGFIPPPSPTLTGELATPVTADEARIRIQTIISFLAAALLARRLDDDQHCDCAPRGATTPTRSAVGTSG